MANNKSGVDDKKWCELIDYEFVIYLLDVIVNANPMDDCITLGDKNDWTLLPKDKSMMYTHEDCGLPIGNLSSQLFSNVYMNEFDQFVKRKLKCKHYGRYVDDAYIVDDKDRLRSIIGEIRGFLNNRLCLDLNENKLLIFDVEHGVEFLGAFVKPYRTYLSISTQRRLQRKIAQKKWKNAEYMRASVNSLLGVMVHHRTYAKRRVLFGNNAVFAKYGTFEYGYSRYAMSMLNKEMKDER